MFGFGNKKKKLAEQNEKKNTEVKQEVLNLVQTLILNGTDGKIISLLNDIKTELSAQSASDSEEAWKLLLQIQAKLNQANTYIVHRQSGPAQTCLNKVKEILETRRALCRLGTQTNEEYVFEEPREEELNLQLSEKLAKRESLYRELEVLHDRLIANPNNYEAKLKWTSTEQAFKMVTSEIERISHELNIEVNRMYTKEFAELEQELEEKRTISDAQNERNKKIIREGKARAEQEKQELKQQEDVFAPNGTHGLDSELFRQMSGASDAPYRQNGNYTNNTPFESELFQQMGGSGNTEKASRSVQINELNRTKALLTHDLDNYNDRMAAADEQSKELEKQLIPLLIRRRSASPAECLTIDSQIDQLNVQRNGFQYEVKRYGNAIAVINEKLLLLNKVLIQKEFDVADARIRQLTEGKFSDYKGLAMYLKESIDRGNERLEEIGTANMVASSGQINTNSYSGADTAYSDVSSGKDEEKYKALETELGLN